MAACMIKHLLHYEEYELSVKKKECTTIMMILTTVLVDGLLQ